MKHGSTKSILFYLLLTSFAGKTAAFSTSSVDPTVSIKGFSPRMVADELKSEIQTLETTRKRRKTKGSKRKATLKATESTAKKATKKRKKNTSPTHWRNVSDPFHFQPEESIRFTIRGNPLPLRRHRTSRGFMYNPSAKAQETFQSLVKEWIATHTVNADLLPPLFPADTSLAATLVFRIKRPLGDFVGNKRSADRLRPFQHDTLKTALAPLHPPVRVDVDNVAKFVLDSLNELVYEDDRQIVSLECIKMRDSEEDCLGATEVCIRAIRDPDAVPTFRLLDSDFEQNR